MNPSEIKEAKSLKAKSIREILGSNSDEYRKSVYLTLKAMCDLSGEECPPLSWFPVPSKKKGV